jgi:glycosyltransferase involved in cell wall biosynthesis
LTEAESPSVLFVDDSAYMGGGALALVNYLEHEHAEVVFLRGGPLLTRARAAGVPVSCLVNTHGRPGLYASLFPLWRVLRRSRHQVVVANSVRAAALVALARPRRGRFVFYVHEEISRHTQPRLRLAFIRRYVFRRFDAYLAVSQWVLDSIQPWVGGKPAILAPPISGSRTFEPSPRESDTAGPLRILSLSRLVHWKGLHVLLAALEELVARGQGANFKLLVAGGGGQLSNRKYEQELQRTASGLPMVEFLDEVARVGPLLQQADVLALCSVLAEPFGTVIVQALASGVYVLATDPGGAVEILGRSAAGEVLPMSDPQALADALARLAADRTALDRARVDGPRVAARYADASLSSHLTEVLTSLV